MSPLYKYISKRADENETNIENGKKMRYLKSNLEKWNYEENETKELTEELCANRITLLVKRWLQFLDDEHFKTLTVEFGLTFS